MVSSAELTIGVSSRAGARPSGRMPMRRRGTPSVSWRNTTARRKSAFDTPPPTDRPAEPGLDRGCRLVNVVPVKAEPGLEAQRVAGAKANRPDFRLSKQHLSNRRRIISPQRNLEAVLAGVAGAGDQAHTSVEGGLRRGHEAEPGDGGSKAR
jgi:hypothetical protein